METAREILNRLRDMGAEGGTMVAFPFEALYCEVDSLLTIAQAAATLTSDAEGHDECVVEDCHGWNELKDALNDRACGTFHDSQKPGLTLRARVTVLEAALRTIAAWDMLNPPHVSALADGPWLKKLVDDALASH